MSETTYAPGRWIPHTPYSDPGRYADLLSAVPPTIPELSAVAQSLIVHYRASGLELPAETKDDINAPVAGGDPELDQQRHPVPLDAPREPLTGAGLLPVRVPAALSWPCHLTDATRRLERPIGPPRRRIGDG